MYGNIVCKKATQKETIGTGLIGKLLLNYDEIKKIFGKPEISDGVKIDWIWKLKLNDIVLTIYNWKDGPSYTKNKKIKRKDIEKWNIGGNRKYDLHILEDYIFIKDTDNKFLVRKIIEEA